MLIFLIRETIPYVFEISIVFDSQTVFKIKV